MLILKFCKYILYHKKENQCVIDVSCIEYISLMSSCIFVISKLSTLYFMFFSFEHIQYTIPQTYKIYKIFDFLKKYIE